MRQMVAEYDENGCVWLIDVVTKARVPLAHGEVIEVGSRDQRLHVAAQAVVERWRFGRDTLHKTYGFSMERDLLALEQAIKAMLREEEAS